MKYHSDCCYRGILLCPGVKERGNICSASECKHYKYSETGYSGEPIESNDICQYCKRSDDCAGVHNEEYSCFRGKSVVANK